MKCSREKEERLRHIVLKVLCVLLPFCYGCLWYVFASDMVALHLALLVCIGLIVVVVLLILVISWLTGETNFCKEKEDEKEMD